ncbi:hypothetical protein EYS14_16225 [Alteromonadaceae bacterium M269]|nr:hypothetical protein EYS14_16225 [Alteromonadaceae bacterium M269]
MFKKLAASVAVLTALSFNTQAFEIDTEACAGVEHIRDLTNTVVPYDPAIHTFVTEDTPVFYAGKEKIPHLETGIRTSTFIIVTNTTSSRVSFFFNPVFHTRLNGLRTNLSNQSLLGVFNSSNNPFDGAGSNMPPNSQGSIFYPTTANPHEGYAEILWDSSTCFKESPMLTTVRNEWLKVNEGSGRDFYYVNNGETW